jgi:hypothetical protein
VDGLDQIHGSLMDLTAMTQLKPWWKGIALEGNVCRHKNITTLHCLTVGQKNDTLILIVRRLLKIGFEGRYRLQGWF